MGTDRTIPDLLAVSDAEARRLLRIALEEGQKVQDRAERLGAELREAREALADLLAPLEQHEIVLVGGACNVPGYVSSMTGKWSGDSWPDMSEARDRARGVLEKGTGG